MNELTVDEAKRIVLELHPDCEATTHDAGPFFGLSAIYCEEGNLSDDLFPTTDGAWLAAAQRIIDERKS